MHNAKRAKVHTSPLPFMSTAPTEATSSVTVGQLSETRSQSLKYTAEAQDQKEETLDDSSRVPITKQPSEDSSDESSSDEFSSEDAQQKYNKQLKEQPKDNIKMMAVMFTYTLISMFNVTACGAANEVGLVLNYMRRPFVNGGGTSTTTTREPSPNQSRERNICLFILDREDLHQKAAKWVRANTTIKRES